MDIPCGCDTRREVMFTSGQLGRTELVIILMSSAVVFVTYKYRRT